MMFMIPMPPTISETIAIPASSIVRNPLCSFALSSQVRLVEDPHVRLLVRAELVALRERCVDLVLGLHHPLFGDAPAR